MANAYINAYVGSTLISNGDGTSPITFGPLNATNNEESAPVAVTLKTTIGYKTVGNTTVGLVSDTGAKFSLCATSGGTYASTLTISDVITEIGVTFYVKAKATADENPSIDTSVDLSINSKIGAV